MLDLWAVGFLKKILNQVNNVIFFYQFSRQPIFGLWVVLVRVDFSAKAPYQRGETSQVSGGFAIWRDNEFFIILAAWNSHFPRCLPSSLNIESYYCTTPRRIGVAINTIEGLWDVPNVFGLPIICLGFPSHASWNSLYLFKFMGNLCGTFLNVKSNMLEHVLQLTSNQMQKM